MEENNSGYRLPLDAALLSFSILKRLGVGSVATFDERLKSQKVQYLAQAFGVSPNYAFNLYVRGPYSPDLASDLFRVNSQQLIPDTSAFIPEELEIKFQDLKGFIADKDNRKLELVATMHWLLKVTTLPYEDAAQKLMEWKGATEKELAYVMGELARL